MNDTGQFKQDLHLQRRHLAHHLWWVEQLIFGDGLHSVSIGGIQVDSLDQLHIV